MSWSHHSPGSTYVDVWEPRWHILLLTSFHCKKKKKGKKGVKLQHVEDRFPLFTEALGFLRILPQTSGLLEVCCVIVDRL